MCRPRGYWFLLQAQVSHVVSSFHSRTPSQYRVPSNAYTIFLWINVLLLCLVPHLFALRCCLSPAFFRRSTNCTEQSWQRECKKLEWRVAVDDCDDTVQELKHLQVAQLQLQFTHSALGTLVWGCSASWLFVPLSLAIGGKRHCVLGSYIRMLSVCPL